jgi:hypothetical protein
VLDRLVVFQPRRCPTEQILKLTPDAASPQVA